MVTATDSRHPSTEMEAKTHARIKEEEEAQRPIQDEGAGSRRSLVIIHLHGIGSLQ